MHPPLPPPVTGVGEGVGLDLGVGVGVALGGVGVGVGPEPVPEVTTKFRGSKLVPRGLVMFSCPVEAPLGIVSIISESLTTRNETPVKLPPIPAELVPVKPDPVTVTTDPEGPEEGETVCMYGAEVAPAEA